jgi:hypothetical protein
MHAQLRVCFLWWYAKLPYRKHVLRGLLLSGVSEHITDMQAIVALKRSLIGLEHPGTAVSIRFPRPVRVLTSHKTLYLVNAAAALGGRPTCYTPIQL